jgi:hypothetical protein
MVTNYSNSCPTWWGITQWAGQSARPSISTLFKVWPPFPPASARVASMAHSPGLRRRRLGCAPPLGAGGREPGAQIDGLGKMICQYGWSKGGEQAYPGLCWGINQGQPNKVHQPIRSPAPAPLSVKQDVLILSNFCSLLISSHFCLIFVYILSTKFI